MAAQDPGTGAKTLLYHIEVDRGIPWDSAHGMLASSSAAAQVRAQEPMLTHPNQSAQLAVVRAVFSVGKWCCVSLANCFINAPQDGSASLDVAAGEAGTSSPTAAQNHSGFYRYLLPQQDSMFNTCD